MMLEETPEIKLPRFQVSSYGRGDRMITALNVLILEKVEKLSSGELLLIAKPSDGGHERVRGRVRFTFKDEGRREYLYKWFEKQIGQTITSIYRSDYSFQ